VVTPDGFAVDVTWEELPGRRYVGVAMNVRLAAKLQRQVNGDLFGSILHAYAAGDAVNTDPRT
jgi:hypothetical protein